MSYPDTILHLTTDAVIAEYWHAWNLAADYWYQAAAAKGLSQPQRVALKAEYVRCAQKAKEEA